MLSESHSYLAFHYCPNIGPQRFSSILSVFKTATKAWTSSDRRWRESGLPNQIIDTVIPHRKTFDLSKTIDLLARLQIQYLYRDDQDFPYLLKQIHDCPLGLFIKGSLLQKDSQSLAVVGTRHITPYGREVTTRLVTALVQSGLTVVSGLARGVDGVAHRVALERGGRTIAVLGSGLDQIYPPEHKSLASDIAGNGALLSEYPPGTQPAPGNFPARNRIVSGLSLGVLVTEGASKSGSKITALIALDQNREVFAVPGPITSPMSAAPAQLIQMGAKLVVNACDIVSELQLKSYPMTKSSYTLPVFTDKTQETIFNQLNNGVQHIDDIIRVTGLPTSIITTTLTMMELKGIIKNLGEGNYMTL